MPRLDTTERVFPNAEALLKTIETLEEDRKNANIESTDEEKRTLDTLKKDAIHDIVFHRDNAAYADVAKLKQIELEYLHQVRGIRQVMPSAIFGDGYSGYGNGWTGNKMRLLYAQDRKRSGREAKELVLPNPLVDETAKITEELVPVRIDFDNDKYRLKDTFCWNVNDSTVPLDLFVENMLEDFALPLNLAGQLKSSIEDQLSGYVRHPFSQGMPEPEPKVEKVEKHDTDKSDAEVKTEPDEKAKEPLDYDLRVVININITIGQHTLVDQFEWDINNPDNDPEQFAEVLVQEMALPQEFAAAVAHAIREQVNNHIKTFMQAGSGFDGRPVPNKDPVCDFEVGARTFLRPPDMMNRFSPSLHQVSNEAIQAYGRESKHRRRRFAGRNVRNMSSISISDVTEFENINTPYFNSLLPGGMDRNIDILRTFIYNQDHGNSSLVRGFNRYRSEPGMPSASLFSSEMGHEEKERYMVTLKLPRASRRK